jgi:ketosteroid isomerase-like protein
VPQNPYGPEGDNTMKHLLLILCVTILACAFGFAQMQQGAPSDTSSTAEQLKKIENDWAKAAVNKDRATLDRIEAEDYILIMPDGKIRNKQQDLDSLAQSNITSMTVSDMDVRVFGDTAEVIGIGRIRGTENGKDISGDYRFTDVFVKKNGEWKAVSTEVTKMTP